MPDQLLRMNLQGAVQIIELTLPEVLDSAQFDELNDAAQQAIDAAPAGGWVIDLTGTDYMGSAVLGLLVNIRQRIRQKGGQLILCGLSPRLTSVFHACSLERLFAIVKTRPEALRAAQA